MIAAEYASPMPGSDFSSSWDAVLISISLEEVELVEVWSVADDLALELLGGWYGAAINDSAVSRKTIHLVIFVVSSPRN